MYAQNLPSSRYTPDNIRQSVKSNMPKQLQTFDIPIPTPDVLT